jgi:hypothetical protein
MIGPMQRFSLRGAFDAIALFMASGICACSSADPRCGAVVQGESCSAAGEVCPGGSLVCMSCGNGGYAITTNTCTCVSSKFSCAAPSPNQSICPAVPQYADPMCSVAYSAASSLDGGAGDAGRSSDAAWEAGEAD